jgi:hypothetical protein
MFFSFWLPCGRERADTQLSSLIEMSWGLEEDRFKGFSNTVRNPMNATGMQATRQTAA